MIFRVVRTTMAGLLALSLGGAVAQAQQAPQAIIEKLGGTMIDTMRNAKALGYTGRFQKLAPEIVAAFNLPYMVSIAVGSAWKTTTPDQQQRLVDAFARYMVAVHASRLDGFSGEQFKVNSANDLPNGNGVIVKAQFVKSGGSTENIDYVMQKQAKGWQIVDVFYKSSISEVATRRSEYISVIKDAGVERLIAKMDEKTAELGHTKTSTN